jgi:TorA maturation chaperone TorD
MTFCEADIARCRSAVYSALAMALAEPDTDGDETASRRGALVLGELLEACGAEDVASGARGLMHKAPCAVLHQRLFGHTAEGAVPPYETHYGTDTLFQQPRELSDIGAFVAAFGLALDPARHERGDHVSCECEMMAFLAGKEAYALDHADDAMLAVTRDAEAAFLRDHLGRFAPAFGERLRRADGDGFYGTIGRLLRGFVEFECERAGVEVGSPSLALRKAAPDDAAPMACGSGEGCTLGKCE